MAVDQDALELFQPQIDALLRRVEMLEARPSGGRSEAQQLFWEKLTRADNQTNGSEELWKSLNTALDGVLSQ